jgi:lipopolysaccharide/colanic/teichoic acid biosynthesis glycosyltransferase
MFDIVFSAMGLLLAFPVFVIAALTIKADSSGPVFYRGIRTGRYGKYFKIYKFRTMFVGREKSGGDTTALNDSRVTRVGTFLRKYKIDELPQLINVLKGEMSIVGPRPELPTYTEKYSEEEKIILNVKPGITDHSSIELRYLDEIVGEREADRVFEERILPRKNKLRIKYVKTQSFRGDLAIIGRTLAAVFAKSRRGK